MLVPLYNSYGASARATASSARCGPCHIHIGRSVEVQPSVSVCGRWWCYFNVRMF
jgi:hypothetical protein